MTTSQPFNQPINQPTGQPDTTTENTAVAPIRFAIPKGRMADGVHALLKDAGIRIRAGARDYRPTINLAGYTVKILKPRAVIEMLDLGTRDLGFAGADWVAEDSRDIVELLDTRLDPVRLVAAAPESILVDGPHGRLLPDHPLRVASEYANLTKRWMKANDIKGEFVLSYGATEVLPPDDADCIVDNTATGATLAANGLRILDDLAASSTRLYASKQAMADDAKRARIEEFVMLVQSVLEARSRVTLEVNIAADRLPSILETLPCMREPTVASTYAGSDTTTPTGFAVKVAVPRADLPTLIPQIKAKGGTDIIVTNPEQIVP
jgi:ATP phosphoribosyltransferase